MRRRSVSRGLRLAFIGFDLGWNHRLGTKRTEDEFLCGCKHVEGDGDFILIVFQSEPADEGGDD